MNDKHVEDLINALFDLIQDARAVPMAAGKCFLERERALDLLEEIIDLLPTDLKESRSIVQSRNDLLLQARHEAENIVLRAREEAEQLVSEHVLLAEAKRQCALLMEETEAKIERLKQVSNAYMDDALARTEEAMAQALREVQDTRARFQAMTAPKEKEPAATGEE